MLQRRNSLILIWFLLAVFSPSLLRAVIQGRFWVKCVCVSVCACVCLWHRKLLTNSQERERKRERGRSNEEAERRREPRREGWIERVRDWAEESVKLQQPGDKSFSLPLPASACKGYSRGVKPAEGETSPGCLLSLELLASPDQQASKHKRTAGQDTLVDTYAERLTQLTRGPPNLAGSHTHSDSLLDCHTLAVSLAPTVSIGSIQPCLSDGATTCF